MDEIRSKRNWIMYVLFLVVLIANKEPRSSAKEEALKEKVTGIAIARMSNVISSPIIYIIMQHELLKITVFTVM
jgi:hypothetical protein